MVHCLLGVVKLFSDPMGEGALSSDKSGGTDLCLAGGTVRGGREDRQLYGSCAGRGGRSSCTWACGLWAVG